jgi:dTDP-4-dehydrorhamnose 3,5-epimerase
MELPKLLTVKKITDERGYFQKILSQSLQRELGIEEFRALEMFSTSTTRYGVRGMHIQVPPCETRKILWVSQGEIIDVLVDVNSGEIFTFKLNENSERALYIPNSFAHGFQVISDNATVNYLTDNEFNQEFDSGFHFNSFGFTWPKPIGVVSKKDQGLASFKEFCAKG